MSISSYKYPIQKINAGTIENTNDWLAVEEPLEIRISFLNEQGQQIVQPLSVTMRTPFAGQDIELTCGFLLTEGIIRQREDIQKALQLDDHVVLIILAASVRPDMHRLERHFYTSSSCGVCGKTSIDTVKTICPDQQLPTNFPAIHPAVIYNLPQRLSGSQNTFAATGGLHASALFDADGKLLLVREDVGRHNALDKLIGATLLENIQPLQNKILLLSGRASFELIQKATMADIYFVCAVGAPSSLAVQLAAERNMTLVGFLRDGRFNIYCGPERIMISEPAENTLKAEP
jgi:FdhD protein